LYRKKDIIGVIEYLKEFKMKVAVVGFNDVVKMDMNMSPSLYISDIYQEYKERSREELMSMAQEALKNASDFTVDFLLREIGKKDSDIKSLGIDVNRALSANTIQLVSRSLQDRKLDLGRKGGDAAVVSLVVLGLISSTSSLEKQKATAQTKRQELIKKLKEIDSFLEGQRNIPTILNEEEVKEVSDISPRMK